MKDLLNIALSGVSGQMNSLIIELVLDSPNINIVSSYARKNSNNIGKSIDKSLVSSNLDNLGIKGGVIIDFTNPKLTKDLINTALKFETPLVIGTTGLVTKDEKLLNEASKKIPIVYCSNTSIGITLLEKIVEDVSGILDEEWDIEILETHHGKKIDAPSGTALSLGKSAARGRKVNLEKVYVSRRNDKRKKGQIGFSVMRGGDVAGEHTVNFFGKSERIEIIHRTTNRMIFAKGAIKAAHFANSNISPGLYTMKDVLNL